MEFNISSADLLKAVMDISKAVPAKSSLPILENFLFKVEDGVLEITGSDQELTLRSRISVEEVESGAIAVPAHQIVDLLKTVPDQPINIKTDSDSAFEFTWNNGNSTLPYFPAEDYPEIKGVEDDAKTVTFPAKDLCEGLGSTVYATGEDEMRPVMNGVFFDMGTESSTLVASDSHKLICYTSENLKAPEKASFILHKRPAGVLKSLLEREDGDVQVRFDASGAVFSFGGTMMVCRLIVGNYPNYRVVIPQNNANILRIERTRLLDSVRRVAVCANKASNHIKFDLKPSQLEITAQDLGYAIAAYEKLSCEYDGVEMAIGFKSSFLIEILSNMTCENVVMKFADPRRAALIVPSDEDASKDKVCGIIMPIMVA